MKLFLVLSTLFLSIFSQNSMAIKSNYFAYIYTDKNTSNEHCCVTRSDNQMCTATPLTSRLILINKQCQTLEKQKKTSNYLDRIVRRLEVEKTHRVGKKVFLQLEKPLSSEILRNDLLCLSTTSNQIELDQCFIQLVHRKNESKSNQTDSDDSDHTEMNQIQLDEPIVVRKGEGLSVLYSYSIDRNNIQEGGRCWNWYRQQTKRLCQSLSKYPEKCVELTNEEEKCLEKLVLDSSSLQSVSIDLNKHSKLFCKNKNQVDKLLGRYQQSQVCFQLHDKFTVEHKFSDLVRLSESNQNQEIFEFIANNDELKQDFERDCKDTETLEGIKAEPVVEPIVESENIDGTIHVSEEL